MGWSHLSSSSEHFEFTDNKAHIVRFYCDEPVSALFRNIPSTKSGSPVDRPFRSTVSKIEEEIDDQNAKCRSGLDGMKDPLWEYLSERDKFNQDRGDRQKIDKNSPKHFQYRMHHFFTVWNYEKQTFELVDGGTQLARAIHAEMKMQGITDLRKNDWLLTKKVENKQTQYLASVSSREHNFSLPSDSLDVPDPSSSIRLKPIPNVVRFIEIGEAAFDEDGNSESVPQTEKVDTPENPVTKSSKKSNGKQAAVKKEESKSEEVADVAILRDELYGILETESLFPATKDIHEFLGLHAKGKVKQHTRIDKYPDELLLSVLGEARKLRDSEASA
jgi:hypothetical protein